MSLSNYIIGIKGKEFQLLKSYMSYRTQAKINQHSSKPLPITYGFPQGSKLGHSLFTIYIKLLCNVEIDDIVLLLKSKDWNRVMNHGYITYGNRTETHLKGHT